ncbi:hypothetical protein [Gulosibacter molinativorax]|uniref:Uncharacterized protein n=1 Tax=Gulosibacter molinativorax TaxID=256821 RepID=A0ABT7C9I9_9MICO|nr:hypothetical protein [Gulosibacter molinativorax]MDJ1371760.1 hypothetical protein [Gulosibacter molinativorax]QUY60872.1 Hypotetical protein [Gulosibacter molinativorax]
MSELSIFQDQQLAATSIVPAAAVREIYRVRDAYQADLDKALREIRAGGSLQDMERWTRVARQFVELIISLNMAAERLVETGDGDE